MPQCSCPCRYSQLALGIKPHTAHLPINHFHSFPLSISDFQKKDTLHLQSVHHFKGRKIGCFRHLALQGVINLQAASAMRTTDRLAFSLIVKLHSTIATGTFMSRCAERYMWHYLLFCPYYYFGAYGGQPLVGG